MHEMTGSECLVQPGVVVATNNGYNVKSASHCYTIFILSSRACMI